MTPSPHTTVVTGASSGIGAATTQLLAARGHRLVLIGRNHDAVTTLKDGLPDVEAGPHHALTCDVAIPTQVSTAVASIIEIPGVPDGLVNAAGICSPAPLDELTPESWMATLQTNLTGTFLMSQAIATGMRRAAVTGSIVNLGSEASLIGMPHYAAYCASKAGVVGLTRSMAAELAPDIRVNVLCPGPVDTPMLRAELEMTGDPAAAWAAELARVPLRKVATAHETAEAAVWLLTAATNATGSVLSLDGGTTGAFYGANSR
jgi:NAD(P)-dependent dehydrogenase (short-subunit alcohol dehydrogenase family)